MKIPWENRLWLRERIKRKMRRPPDLSLVRGGMEYMRRWKVFTFRPFGLKLFNVYIHEFVGLDWSGEPHDHPWHSLSIIISGVYNEELYKLDKSRHSPQIVRKSDTLYTPGDVIFRSPNCIHKIEARSKPVITLFITGPDVKDWGFFKFDGTWTQHDQWVEENVIDGKPETNQP